MAFYELADVGTELAQQGLDACTLNNALNVAQLVALLVVIKWLRSGDPPRAPEPPRDSDLV